MNHFFALAAVGVFGLLFLLCLLALPLLVGALVVTSFVLWVWMLVDALRNDHLSGWARVGWVALIWFTHWIGALIYLGVARKGLLIEERRRYSLS